MLWWRQETRVNTKSVFFQKIKQCRMRNTWTGFRVRVNRTQLGACVTDSPTLAALSYQGTVAELLNILSQTRQFSLLAAIQYLEGIVIPKLLLNSETWNKITEEEQHQLEQIQSQAIKRMLHIPYSTSTRGLYSELGLMTIKNRILKRKLMFLHKIMNKPEGTLSKSIMLEQESLPGNNWLKEVKKATRN